ncbi:hypothetical protein HMSSN139_68330 [Paenibacillus sp. HMSSN-139]|nr:hypothetical protein HMSSN139_68330 [Paenibacillus sp. HMSSN-139]
MGKGALLVYKCRRCGCYDRSYRVPGGMIATMAVIMGHPMPKEWGAFTPAMIETHSCGDGGIGITDFIGCEHDTP